MQAHPERPRQHPIIAFGRGKRLTPYLFFAPLAAGLVASMVHEGGVTLGSFAAAFAVGLVLWTVVEYALHRFAFHSRSEALSKIHGLHHHYALDPYYMVAPVAVSVPIFSLLWLALWGLSGSLAWSGACGLGIIVGYLAYEYVHIETHLGRARTPWMKYLKRYHMLHHHADDTRYFGVTTPLWDGVWEGLGGKRGRGAWESQRSRFSDVLP